MYVAVPEPGSYNETVTIKHGHCPGQSWHCYLGARSEGAYAAVMHEDCAIFDRWVGRRGVNLCVNQREVRSKAVWVRDKGPKKHYGEHRVDSHANIYGGGHMIVPETRRP